MQTETNILGHVNAIQIGTCSGTRTTGQNEFTIIADWTELRLSDAN